MKFARSDYLDLFKWQTFKRNLAYLPVVIVMASLLQACGQKGDLYLPVVEREQKIDASSPQQNSEEKKKSKTEIAEEQLENDG